MSEAEVDFDTASSNSSEGSCCTKKDSNCSDFSWENSDSSEVGILYQGKQEQRNNPSEKVNISNEGLSHVPQCTIVFESSLMGRGEVRIRYPSGAEGWAFRLDEPTGLVSLERSSILDTEMCQIETDQAMHSVLKCLYTNRQEIVDEGGKLILEGIKGLVAQGSLTVNDLAIVASGKWSLDTISAWFDNTLSANSGARNWLDLRFRRAFVVYDWLVSREEAGACLQGGTLDGGCSCPDFASVHSDSDDEKASKSKVLDSSLFCLRQSSSSPMRMVESMVDLIRQQLREDPLLPRGSTLPLPGCHCAFKDCNWIGDDDAALATHLLQSHTRIAQRCRLTNLQSGFSATTFEYYCAAVREQCRTCMSPVSADRDRRHRSQFFRAFCDEHLQCLVCAICARTLVYDSGDVATSIKFRPAFENSLFLGMTATGTENVLGLQKYTETYDPTEAQLTAMEQWTAQVCV